MNGFRRTYNLLPKTGIEPVSPRPQRGVLTTILLGPLTVLAMSVEGPSFELFQNTNAMIYYVRAAVHLVLFVVFVWVVKSDMDFLPAELLPIPGYSLSKLAWLTIVDLYMQVGYHAFAVYISLTSASDSALFHRFHFISTAIMLPVAFTVGILFWSLHLIDPKLLIPEGLEKFFVPNFLRDHSQHTLPAFAMLTDHILWVHSRPNKLRAFNALLIFAFLYIVDIHLVYAISGNWVYGIMGQLSFLFRWLFVLACAILLYLVFLVGDALNVCFHPSLANKQAYD
uniref:TLC domain-containing protein n=1 Tax=Ascaris lumbricoides TaxID=6252 RepID=A0A9J2Q176_ASCLU